MIETLQARADLLLETMLARLSPAQRTEFERLLEAVRPNLAASLVEVRAANG